MRMVLTISYEKGRLIRKTTATRLDSTSLSGRDSLMYNPFCRVRRYIPARFTEMKIEVEGADNLWSKNSIFTLEWLTIDCCNYSTVDFFTQQQISFTDNGHKSPSFALPWRAMSTSCLGYRIDDRFNISYYSLMSS